MKIEANATIAFPRELSFQTYRDHLPDLVPYLPNVKRIDVKEDESNAGGVASRTRKLNIWHAKADVPTIAQSIIKPEMLSWEDHAVWDESAWTCEWKVKPAFFAEAIRCEGKNQFVDQGTTCVLQIRGDLEIDATRIKAIPRLLAGTIGPAIEKFVVALLTPNLTSVSKGVEQYLRAKA